MYVDDLYLADLSVDHSSVEYIPIDGLYVADSSVGDLYVGDLSVDDPSVGDLSVDGLYDVCNVGLALPRSP